MTTCQQKKNTKKDDELLFEFAEIIKTSLCSRIEDEVSFRFNVASLSGSTSYLGRSKTVLDKNRPAIDSAHQPQAPDKPVVVTKTNASSVRNQRSLRSARSAVFTRQASSRSSREEERRGGRGGGRLQSSTRAAHRRTFGHPAPTPPPTFSAQQQQQVLPMARQRLSQSPAFQSARMASSGFAFGNPNTSFGAPAPGLFGAPAPAPSSSYDAQEVDVGVGNNDEPLWLYSMTIPVSSNTPYSTYGNMPTTVRERVINEMRHQCNLLARHPSINFFCDVCQGSIGNNQDRFHCLDCDDFDMCGMCVARPGGHDAQHRITRIAAASADNKNYDDNENDPLVLALLKPKVVPTTSSLPETKKCSDEEYGDRAMTLIQLRIQRFLVGLLHWWPIVCSTIFNSGEYLPLVLSSDLKARISSAVGKDNGVEDLLNVARDVLDLLDPVDKERNPW